MILGSFFLVCPILWILSASSNSYVEQNIVVTNAFQHIGAVFAGDLPTMPNTDALFRNLECLGQLPTCYLLSGNILYQVFMDTLNHDVVPFQSDVSDYCTNSLGVVVLLESNEMIFFGDNSFSFNINFNLSAFIRTPGGLQCNEDKMLYFELTNRMIWSYDILSYINSGVHNFQVVSHEHNLHELRCENSYCDGIKSDDNTHVHWGSGLDFVFVPSDQQEPEFINIDDVPTQYFTPEYDIEYFAIMINKLHENSMLSNPPAIQKLLSKNNNHFVIFSDGSTLLFLGPGLGSVTPSDFSSAIEGQHVIDAVFINDGLVILTENIHHIAMCFGIPHNSSEVCSGNGVCSNIDQCVCDGFWGGDQCNLCEMSRTIHCSNNGDPVTSDCTKCECDAGTYWSGTFCDHCDLHLLYPTGCYHGKPASDCRSCECDYSWTSTLCDVCAMTQADCGLRGVPDSNCQFCECDNNWTGDYCGQCSMSRAVDCNGNGEPDQECLYCVCDDASFTGNFCNSCTMDRSSCNHHGEPAQSCDKCLCDHSNWLGDYCDECGITAASCHNRGSADSNCEICECSANWSGSDCATCPMTRALDCHGNGDPDTDCQFCVCDGRWEGDFCSVCGMTRSDCSNAGEPVQATCDVCVCDTNSWTGTFCDLCPITRAHCNMRGGPDDNCEFCSCDVNSWAGNTCDECPMSRAVECNGNGDPDIHCLYCECDESFDGHFCNNCPMNRIDDCNDRGFPAPTCDVCVCDTATNWQGYFCDECPITVFDCNFRGVADANCEFCDCHVDNWTGPDCQVCPMTRAVDCNGNGDPDEECRFCDCDAHFSGDHCEFCTMTRASDCNDAGIPKSTCDGCECDWNNKWTGTFCDVCSMTRADCNMRGQPDTNCQHCMCDVNNWGGNDCTDCLMSIADCHFNGVPDDHCLHCVCNGFFTGDFCDECSLDRAGSCNDHGDPDIASCASCTCDTGSNWQGPFCDACGLSRDDCGNKGEPDGNCELCVCDVNNWLGDNCEVCPMTRASHCHNNGEPDSHCLYCICDAGYSGHYCDNCPMTRFHDCNDRGEPAVTCDKCVCDHSSNLWGGDFCNECSLTNADCNNRGIGDANCEFCTCNVNNWSGDHCETCPMTNVDDCNNHGSPDSSCLYCDCDGFFVGNYCDRCPMTRVDDCNNAGNPNGVTCDSCICDTFEWSGTFCDECSMTRGSCGNKGEPDSNCRFCTCEGFWGGDYCSECTLDTIDCNDHGNPDEEYCLRCTCEDYWDGKFCDQCSLTRIDNCNSRGNPNANSCDKCDCDTNQWEGDWCDVCPIDEADCNYRGLADAECNTCDCFVANWVGADCSLCPMTRSVDCNGHGVPDDDCDVCVCDDLWTGDYCDTCLMTRTADCNSAGDPNLDTCDSCSCDDSNNWIGRFCDVCPMKRVHCFNRGEPDSHCDKCDCDVNNWAGDFCDICPMTRIGDCNGHGEPDPRFCFHCECDDGFGGDFCDQCTMNRADHCNGRGDPVTTTCDRCICDNQWAGNWCETCDVTNNALHCPDSFALPDCGGCFDCSSTMPNCERCTSDNTCTLCNDNAKFLLSRPSECHTEASCRSLGNEYVPVEGDRSCKTCTDLQMIGCSVCDSDRNCHVCDNATPYKKDDVTPNICYSKDECWAIPGHFPSLIDKKCKQCPINHCVQCHDENTCSKCDEVWNQEYYLQTDILPSICHASDAACKQINGPGYIANPVTKKCERCEESGLLNCKECKNHLTCKVCNSGYILVKEGLDTVCRDCNDLGLLNCLECSPPGDKCSKCRDGFALQSGASPREQCISDSECLGLKMVVDENGNCRTCKEVGVKNCAECEYSSIGAKKCLECIPDWSLAANGTCVKKDASNQPIPTFPAVDGATQPPKTFTDGTAFAVTISVVLVCAFIFMVVFAIVLFTVVVLYIRKIDKAQRQLNGS